MPLPKLAIVGRPNVGKSQLFNRILGKRVAIVDEAEGITRDRLYSKCEHFGKHFELIDTGGIDLYSEADFNKEIRQQAEIAIEEADSLILVVDSQVGITELDREVAQILLRSNKPLCLAVNKVDDECHISNIHSFHSLGIQKLWGVSAAHGYQVMELLDEATAGFPVNEANPQDGKIRVAIVGRPNVGKSTLINELLGQERCIVSPIAGTTRDSIDCEVEVDGQPFIFIDTAGIRRKQKEKEVVDKFAFIRTERAIERADVALLLLDSQSGMTHQEKRIANLIEEKGKGCVLFLNKWDLVKGFRMEHCSKQLSEEVPFLKHCPTLFGSAKLGRNTDQIFSQLKTVYNACNERITTGMINRVIEQAIQNNHPPMLQGRRLRIYYGAQVSTNPPNFVLFVNTPGLCENSWKRYLISQFRKSFPFPGAPLRFFMKGKAKQNEQKKGRTRSTQSSMAALAE